MVVKPAFPGDAIHLHEVAAPRFLGRRPNFDDCPHSGILRTNSVTDRKALRSVALHHSNAPDFRARLRAAVRVSRAARSSALSVPEAKSASCSSLIDAASLRMVALSLLASPRRCARAAAIAEAWRGETAFTSGVPSLREVIQRHVKVLVGRRRVQNAG